jgi:hypothetical protein
MNGANVLATIETVTRCSRRAELRSFGGLDAGRLESTEADEIENVVGSELLPEDGLCEGRQNR